MVDRPILFSAPMIKALLAGRKTQTRRVIKPRGTYSLFELGQWSDSYVLDPGNASWRERDIRFASGDMLWAKETWRFFADISDDCEICYLADGSRFQTGPCTGDIPDEGLASYFKRCDKARLLPTRSLNVPSIFMPRWASRVTLAVTDVRAQRLHDCTEADAFAEGATCYEHDNDPYGPLTVYHHGQELGEHAGFNTALDSYRHLWNSINGPASWEANPWIVAVSFDVIRGNIDRLSHPTTDREVG